MKVPMTGVESVPPDAQAKLFHEITDQFQKDIQTQVKGQAIVICRYGDDHMAIGLPRDLPVNDCLILTTEGLRGMLSMIHAQLGRAKTASTTAH